MRKKILVVEDNPINRRLLVGILSPHYKVTEAENGLDALDALKRAGSDFAIILLDLIMPVMDGYEFMEKVKQIPEYAAIPIIVTTQNDSETDEVNALARGATDFVTKPYKPRVLLHRISSIIRFREAALLSDLLTYDRLTGVYTKEYFFHQAGVMMEQNPDKEYCIVCSDVENFKLYNDRFGQEEGNALLRTVADMHIEMSSMGGICGRLYADRFVSCVEKANIEVPEVYEKIREDCKQLAETKRVKVNWGIYSVNGESIPVERMCDRAVLAARSIKDKYNVNRAFYDESMSAKIMHEQEIVDVMETALAERQFVVYMQPKVSISESVLFGAESLVRWIHTQWGFQSPGEFVPIFERNGFITKLDRFVWEETCRVLRKWDDLGYAHVRVSVNMSRVDIYHEDTVDFLVNLVKKYELEPSRLHIEITESAYSEDTQQLLDTVKRLHDNGFIIEMDDFGQGYSSLNMLSVMPIDVLKLDLNFIKNDMEVSSDKSILKFIMDLAHSLELSVIAEGVETKTQLERLKEAGCKCVQGYYFSKPMPLDSFEENLKDDFAEIVSKNI